MKKKILSAAVLAAMGVGSAQAVNLSQDGTGEVLIFPYYTTNGGHKTLITVVNTTNDTKAVKVRFREGMNSREVLDFNLYLSPQDVWAGSVSEGADGGAILQTNDTSCTVPAIGSAGVAFVDYAYADHDDDGITGNGSTYDGGPETIDRTREGYVEMIEMGIEDKLDVSVGSGLVDAAGLGSGWHAVWDNAGATGNSQTDSTHTSAGVPDNCQGLVNSWVPSMGGWSDVGDNVAINAPTGGLFGMGAVINVTTGTELAVVPTALTSFSNVPQHSYPGTSLPTLANAAPAQSVVLMNDGAAQGARLYVDTWIAGEDAVSAVLQARSVMNQYSVNPDVNAETSWVVTFPTKHFYADDDLNPAGGVALPLVGLSVRDARAPFVNDFVDSENSAADDGLENGKACETVLPGYVDREEQLPQVVLDGPQFSPLPVVTPQSFTLCNEVNVVNFATSDLFSSTYLGTMWNLEANFKNGWAGMGFATAPDGLGHAGHNLINPISTNAYQGLPVIGFRGTRLGNANVGVGAAYDVADQHKYNRVIGAVADVTNAGVAGAYVYGAPIANFDQSVAAENLDSGL